MAHYLISGQNKVGTGVGATGAKAMFWSDKIYVHIDCSGNSASASILASPDGASRWLNITSWAIGVNATATAQLTAMYPFVIGQVDWVSGAANTGTVTMQVVGRLGN